MKLLLHSSAKREYRLNRPSILFLQSLNQVEPLLYDSLPVWIGLQLLCIVAQPSGKFFQWDRRFHRSLFTITHRRISPSQLCEDSAKSPQPAKDCLFIFLQLGMSIMGQFPEPI